MSLRIIGAGLPRTATSSLAAALEVLLDGRCHNMSAIPGHPFALGIGWEQALSGATPDWEEVFAGFTMAVDWPAAAFWRELSEVYPAAPVILSLRTSAEEWWQSANATIFPFARLSLAPDWDGGTHFRRLLERFTGTAQWDDPATLMAAYDRHNAAVRASIPPRRLLEWHPADGWGPICRVLELPVPNTPFPWVNKREDWG